jgi:glycosyltransferase involved in cell wall biosynthesis
MTLVVPDSWADSGAESSITAEPFRVVEAPVTRAGDVNRHVYADGRLVGRVIDELRPDLIDIHEEPVSAVARQWLRAAPPGLPVVMYTAQNIDKRYPPPFSRYERSAHRRVDAFYPCSRQAASVLRGKGFAGEIKVLPLGYDDALFRPGSQSAGADEVVLMLVGRLIPEKGADDAVRVLARVNTIRPARLVVTGEGPEEAGVRRLAVSLGVGDRVEFTGWQDGEVLSASYRAAHVLLVPSRPSTVAEQFGRVIVEAQASGAVVAGYACGAIAEVAGAAGAVVPLGDVEQLTERVARIVSSPDEFARRRDQGIQQSLTRTWTAVAADQLALYQAAHNSRPARTDLPRSPRQRRAAARAEFGPTALTLVGSRPFAVPVLRRGGVFARSLAAVIDAIAELRSAL